MSPRLAPQASADLHNIWQYVAIEGGRIDAADKLIDSITERFALLSGQPFLGRARDDDFGIGLRSFPVGEYVIVYFVGDDDVMILRVVHGRRDLDEIFG